MNQVILIGNLTQEVALSYTTSGKGYAKFTVATNEKFKKSDGTEGESTEFHNVVVWGRLAESVSALSKGQRVVVQGKIHNGSYEKDGVKKYFTQINAYFVGRSLDAVKQTSNFDSMSEDIPF